MVFTGRHVGAEEALALGIADRVVPDADVYAAAVEMAAQFASGPAVALRAAKQAIDDGLELDLDAALRLETALFAGLFATEDQKAGMQSFVENGPGQGASSPAADAVAPATPGAGAVAAAPYRLGTAGGDTSRCTSGPAQGRSRAPGTAPSRPSTARPAERAGRPAPELTEVGARA